MNGSEEFQAGENRGLIFGRLESIDQKLATMQASFDRLETRGQTNSTNLAVLSETVTNIRKTVEENEDVKKKLILGIVSSIGLALLGLLGWGK